MLGATGLAKKVAEWIPRPALLGVVLGLGFSFMLEGIRFMSAGVWVAAPLLAFALLANARLAVMPILLIAGAVMAVVQDPAVAQQLAAVRPGFRLPAFAWPTLTIDDLWLGAVLLALPQLPLTFGNALVAIKDENNRHFPDRPVAERGIAISTGLANAWTSSVGGVPVCHGAGGMAGHMKFGARTGGATVMVGALLVVLGLFFADSVGVLLRPLPAAGAGRDPLSRRRGTRPFQSRIGQRARGALRAAHHGGLHRDPRGRGRGLRHPGVPRLEARLAAPVGSHPPRRSPGPGASPNG